MKQIINISFGGRNIAIEDAAHEKVKTYIGSLREYFKNEEGRDEIVGDIEARFAELMSEKMRKGSPHITEEDVDEMIATLGRPEEFAAQDSSGEQGYNPNFTFNEKRRLYRDGNNKVLGGVCSGIANWLNIDPTVVRVLFAIVSFGGFGTGILIYIALWIFLPANSMDVYRGKRMFRDPDNKWLGGVAGGMGAYFNINPNTLRWIFAIPLIISMLKGIRLFGWDTGFDLFPNLFFSGLTGTFIFIYIVLWIVLPEALTPYQKMEMHGKNIDVNSIKENVQNSMGDLNQRLQSWGKEVKESAERLGQKANEFGKSEGQPMGKRYHYVPPRQNRGLGYVIAMIFKAFFVIVGGIIAVSLLALFLTVLFSGFVWAPVNNFLWTNETQQLLGWGTLILFFGTPVVGLLVWLVRKILNVRTPGNYLNWTFSGLWTIGWVCLMFFLASISNDCKRYESVEESVPLQQPTNGRLMLTVSQPEFAYKGNFGWLNDNQTNIEGFSISPEVLKVSAVNIEFSKSDDSLFHITMVKQSLGKTDADALGRAQKIQYAFRQADSLIDLQPGFSIDNSTKYRGQNILVLVQVPVGKTINIDETVYDKLHNVQIEFGGSKTKIKNSRYTTNSIRDFSANTDYTMQSDGSLKNNNNPEEKINSSGSGKDNDYRWEGNRSGSDSVASQGAAIDQNGDTIEYRYNQSPTENRRKEQIQKELEQKQKEIEALSKQLEH